MVCGIQFLTIWNLLLNVREKKKIINCFGSTSVHMGRVSSNWYSWLISVFSVFCIDILYGARCLIFESKNIVKYQNETCIPYLYVILMLACARIRSRNRINQDIIDSPKCVSYFPFMLFQLSSVQGGWHPGNSSWLMHFIARSSKWVVFWNVEF